MKAKIHPNYIEDLQITCSCGNVIIAGSTRKELRTEICSACHPFYTGQQKLMDTTGRVDKFLAKVKKAQKIKEDQVKEVDEELEELLHEEPKEEKAAVQTTMLSIDESEEEAEPVKETEEAKPAKAKAPKAAKAPTKKATAKKPSAKKAEILKNMEGHVLDSTMLVGLYQKKP